LQCCQKDFLTSINPCQKCESPFFCYCLAKSLFLEVFFPKDFLPNSISLKSFHIRMLPAGDGSMDARARGATSSGIARGAEQLAVIARGRQLLTMFTCGTV
jgi:hypothetical protein